MPSKMQTPPREGTNVLCSKEDMIVCSEKGELVECRLLAVFSCRCDEVVVCNRVDCSP